MKLVPNHIAKSIGLLMSVVYFCHERGFLPHTVWQYSSSPSYSITESLVWAAAMLNPYVHHLV